MSGKLETIPAQPPGEPFDKWYARLTPTQQELQELLAKAGHADFLRSVA